MDVLVTAAAVVIAIFIKFGFFYIYALSATRKSPRKSEPFKVVQRAPDPKDTKATRKILVTGGCGFLGSAIVRHLDERFESRVAITVLDKVVHEKFGPLLPSVTYYRGDVCAYSHVLTAATDCACVVHAAAIVSDCLTPDDTVKRVIEQGTRNVVEACLERDVRSLVYTSSTLLALSKSAVNSPSRGLASPFLETAKVPPPDELLGAYARAKAAAERFVLDANSHVLHVIALRPGGIYDFNDPAIIGLVLARKPYPGPGNNRVPVVWVEDAARGHADAVQKLLFPAPDAKRVHGRSYHLCHDPVRDPFLYRELLGGELCPEIAGPKHESVKAAEAAAGVQEPAKGYNAYGLRCSPAVPRWVVAVFAYLNHWFGRTLGIAVVAKALTLETLVLGTSNWPCDVTDARELLGWEPTPWRVVAAKMGRLAASGGVFRNPAAVARKDKVA